MLSVGLAPGHSAPGLGGGLWSLAAASEFIQAVGRIHFVVGKGWAPRFLAGLLALPSTEAALGSLPLGLLYRVALCSVEATGATSSKVLADWSGPPRITSPLINPEPSHPWPNPRSGIACTHWPHLPRTREGAHQVGMVGRLSFLPTAAPHEHARTNA